MKLNVSNELKSRLMHAAENGSVIAKDILLEVKKNVPVEEIIRGTYNLLLHQTQTDGSRHVQENPDRVHGMQQRFGPSQFPGPEQSAGTLVSGEPNRSGTVYVCRAVQKPRTVPAR